MGTAINIAKSIGEAMLRHGAIKYGIGFWEQKIYMAIKNDENSLYTIFCIYLQMENNRLRGG